MRLCEYFKGNGILCIQARDRYQHDGCCAGQVDVPCKEYKGVDMGKNKDVANAIVDGLMNKIDEQQGYISEEEVNTVEKSIEALRTTVGKVEGGKSVLKHKVRESMPNPYLPAEATRDCDDLYHEAQIAKEYDASGLSPSDAGAKLDGGKRRADEVLRSFVDALEAVMEIGDEGAKKYSMDGWLSVEDGFNRYANARKRHEIKRLKGEYYDEDSGQLHLAHEAWNTLAMLQFVLRDNR